MINLQVMVEAGKRGNVEAAEFPKVQDSIINSGIDAVGRLLYF